MQEPNQAPKKRHWDEGTWFALVLGIGLTVFWGPLVGFYMGTVCASPDHYWDLKNADLMVGLKGAFIGFLVGLCSLIYILVVYPSRTEKDVDDWSEDYSHPHFGGH